MNRKTKIIRNVFIPMKGNELQLVNIHFTDRIQAIEPIVSASIKWDEIAEERQKEHWVRKISSRLKPLAAGEIDGHFLLLTPGAIDPHVHFDTPGFEFREDFEHASSAALWGGVTTIIDMPCTSIPPVTNLRNMETKLNALQNRSFVDFAFWGGISGTDFANETQLQKQIKELANAGVVGFKAYLISGMDEFTDLTPAQMEKAAQWVKAVDLPLAVHAEDKELVISRRKTFQAEGKNDWRAYCAARDVQAEEKAVKLMADICRTTKGQIHIVHLSSERGLQIIRKAQTDGIPLSAETCPHYLFFTQNDFNRKKITNFLKTAPPVKFERDKEALWQGLRQGVLQFVTTDHAGCDPEQEKVSANFWQVYGGIPGVEHRVPFLFSEGFLKGRLTLEQTVRLLSNNAAEFFGLSGKGVLQPGNDADFALIDLWQAWTVTANEMHSKGKYTPFEGMRFGAQVKQTFLRGNPVVDRDRNFQTKEKTGRFLKRERA